MDSKGKKEEMENEVKDLTAQFEGMKVSCLTVRLDVRNADTG